MSEVLKFLRKQPRSAPTFKPFEETDEAMEWFLNDIKDVLSDDAGMSLYDIKDKIRRYRGGELHLTLTLHETYEKPLQITYTDSHVWIQRQQAKGKYPPFVLDEVRTTAPRKVMYV